MKLHTTPPTKPTRTTTKPPAQIPTAAPPLCRVTGYNPSAYDAIAARGGGGHTAYDLEARALDEHYHYRLENGTMGHNLGRRLPDGTYQLKEADKFDDERAHVHLEYRNPNTGMETLHDYEK